MKLIRCLVWRCHCGQFIVRRDAQPDVHCPTCGRLTSTENAQTYICDDDCSTRCPMSGAVEGVEV